MEKLYERQIFKNDDVPALNETNLNILTKAVDDIDNRLKDVIPADDYVELSIQTQANAEKAKEEADRAEAIVGIGIATTTQAGIVKPDGEYISVNSDGTISVITDDELNDTSEKPLKNKTVKAALDDLDDKINSVDSLLHESDSTFKFGVDEYGNYGYHKEVEGADSVIPFNDSSVVFFASGQNHNATSWGAMVSEQRKYVNDKLCEWVSMCRVRMKVGGIIHGYYSASGNSTTATTAYGAQTAITRYRDGVGADVGPSTGNQTRIGSLDCVFEVQPNDEIYVSGRGSSGSQYGGYSALLMYSPTETPTT